MLVFLCPFPSIFLAFPLKIFLWWSVRKNFFILFFSFKRSTSIEDCSVCVCVLSLSPNLAGPLSLADIPIYSGGGEPESPSVAVDVSLRDSESGQSRKWRTTLYVRKLRVQLEVPYPLLRQNRRESVCVGTVGIMSHGRGKARILASREATVGEETQNSPLAPPWPRSSSCSFTDILAWRPLRHFGLSFKFQVEPGYIFIQLERLSILMLWSGHRIMIEIQIVII